MKAKIFILMGTVLTWLAMINVAGACGFNHYESKVPDCLR
ncbi:cyclic lactone autoinducer peptide [Desulforamulus aquiferis]|uniref:Cyclic lactone autoinducer peptide n=1 Tax=Desulforamulus aquiferis TaxID=1397668 RepID=A0AAW7ZH25_9FIRM|nr:cyclic lactone autoinducer peptide [Desulforamulus aquiferis]MDO7788688.1 cyclic lactone autoinducer peptide [Desulforamulus aquiferis]